jgi:hypothetical protein
MFTRHSLAGGIVLLSLFAIACSSQHASVSSNTFNTPQAVSPAAPAAPSGAAPANPPSQVTFGSPGSPDTDDANLLARKTSEYAQNMSRLLDQQTQGPATRPSVVQWVEPATQPTPIPNQPAALASARIRDDQSLPMILPESADQIPQASQHTAATTVPSTDDLESKLQKLVHDYPNDLGNQLDYQLLRFVRDEQTPDMADVAQLSGEDRDILLALLDGLNNFRNAAHADGNLMLNRKIQPLLEMADRLRSQAQLAIPTVAFCSEVNSYGVYQPMPSSRFPAGADNQMIVYCEAANFSSVQGSDRMWRTRLKQEMVLYTDTGLAVWPDKPNAESFVDQSHNRRHDFFISRKIELPSVLTAGKYLLKITLTDEESNRVAEANAPLEITPAPESPVAPAAFTPLEP